MVVLRVAHMVVLKVARMDRTVAGTCMNCTAVAAPEVGTVDDEYSTFHGDTLFNSLFCSGLFILKLDLSSSCNYV